MTDMSEKLLQVYSVFVSGDRLTFGVQYKHSQEGCTVCVMVFIW